MSFRPFSGIGTPLGHTIPDTQLIHLRFFCRSIAYMRGFEVKSQRGARSMRILVEPTQLRISNTSARARMIPVATSNSSTPSSRTMGL